MKKIGIGIVVFLVVALVGLGFRTIKPGEVGIVVRFGNVVAVENSGVSWQFPLVTKIVRIPVNQQRIDGTYSTSTKDMQTTTEFVTTQYVVDVSKAKELYISFLGNHAESIIKPVLASVVQDGGSELTIRELIRLMIVESDNTAANIMIDELGGFETINQMISKMGCYNTALNRKMMDTNALESGIDNYTSAKDLGVIMKKLYMNTLISEEYDNEMLSILSHNTDHSKLPYHLPYGATVFNKTGTYSTYGVENDVAIIANENGAFVVSVMTQDGSAVEQIDAMKSLGLNLYENILN